MLVNKLKSEKGNALTVAFLIILPLIAMFTIASLEHNRAVLGTDLDMQQALNDACRSAALCVTPLSQAHNKPMIDPDKAHEVFEYVLSTNLKGGVKDIQYTLVIFNGENEFGLPEGHVYSSEGFVTEISGTLPQEFYISGLNITQNGSGIKTTLTHPGCIAVARSELKPLITGEQTGVRWSSAKIIQ